MYNLLNLLLVPKRITVQLKAVIYTFEGLKTVVLHNQILCAIFNNSSYIEIRDAWYIAKLV